MLQKEGKFGIPALGVCYPLSIWKRKLRSFGLASGRISVKGWLLSETEGAVGRSEREI